MIMEPEKMTTEQNALTNATQRLRAGETLSTAVFGLMEELNLPTQDALVIVLQAYNLLRPHTAAQLDAIDLSAADPDALGLDILDDNDIKLIDAIEVAKYRKEQQAADLPVATVEPEPVQILRDFADEDITALRDEALECLKNGKSVQEAADWLFDTYEDVTEKEMLAVAVLADNYRHKLAQKLVEAVPALTFFESIALPLATKRGWKVVPLFPRIKKVHTSLVPSPLTMASKDPLKIHEWALKEPNANVGVYAEQIEGGLLFLDKDGALSLREKYERETGKKFPQTLLVQSSILDDGNGNVVAKGHWYFLQTPRTLALGKNGGKMNIAEDTTGGMFSLRVHNQYVCSIGSLHPTTGLPYEIAEDYPVLPMPDDLLDWLQAQDVDEPKTFETPEDRGLIPHGQIHPALVSRVGKMMNAGVFGQPLIDAVLQWAEDKCEPPLDKAKIIKETKDCERRYGKEAEQNDRDLLLNQTPTAAVKETAIPIVDDPSENDPRLEMKGEKFDTKVYELIAQRFTPYPDPGEGDLVSLLSHKLVHGSNIPLAYVREPLKAIILHALDKQLAHPAFPKLSLRGNYFSLGESESGKTTGLEWALGAANMILVTAEMHPESLFRYKSETTFIRSFTAEGTQKRDSKGTVKSGRPGHASQFLHIKEGNLVANCSDYFGAVFSMLTNLYDQTEAGTESMTNGDFTAVGIKASTVMCFTPSDYKATFGGKGTIGGGGLNRWGLTNPPEDHSYDDRDWQRLDQSEYQDVITQLTLRVRELRKGEEAIVLIEEPAAAKIRLEVKVMLKTAGKVGKRLMDYFMREQVAQAATSVDGSFVMTGRQAAYAKAWVEAQLQCRLNCWPADTDNKIEDMEHAIRKAVSRHFVSETKLKDLCNFYREGSGGWFVFNTARANAISSGAIKLTGKTRKGTRVYCPGSCSEHPAVKEESPSRR